MRKTEIGWIFAMVVVACRGAESVAAAPARFSKVEAFELVLDNALFQQPKPSGRDYELMLELERIDGQWQAVVGLARDYNTGLHTGYVAQAEVDAKQIELDIRLRVAGDSWVPGGPAEYKIKLARQADARLEGQYQGSFKGQSFSGPARGASFIRQCTLGKDFVPVQPGEHPRTVFRKSDLPQLREKLKTPFGRAAFAKMTGPVGWGVQYQLTGDKKYAKQAQEEAAEIVFKGKGCGAAFAPARALGCQVERVAVSLDLCYDAWPEPFKAQVITWLRKIATRVFSDPKKVSLSANWNVASNHVGSLYAGVAFSGLVLWGEKGPLPPKPTEPFVEVDLPAAKDYRPGKGVPVVPLEGGVVPRKWLVSSLLSEAISTDPMVSVQGLETLRPEVGTTVTIEDYTLTFQPLDDKYVVASENNIVLKDLMGDRDTATFCAYTVLDSRQPGLYKVVNASSNSGRVQMILNGRRMADGQAVRLEKGLYPLLILGRMMIAWGKFQPRLEPAGEKDLPASKALVEAEDRDYQARLAEWEIDCRESERLGGANVEYYKLFRTGRRMMYLLYREAVGTGGFQAEVGHYNKDTTDGPNRYATAYRHCFGYDVSPIPDMTAYLPRHVVSYIFPEQGKPWAQDINGSLHLGGDYFAALLPVVEERWQPAMLWAWNRMVGVTDEASKIKAVADDPAWGFVNYPLDVQPKSPATCLPLAWEAPDYGFYAFRNAWKGGDDIVTQVFLKAHLIGGWNGPNAGTFRIAGLGRAWAVGPTGRERRRWQESVVWLPNDNHYEGALGRLIYEKAAPDGSGVVTVDYQDVYSTHKEKQRLYSSYGGRRNDWAFVDSGISGLRSFAVDYSGKCGAPALFVVVDKVRGGKDKVWLWQVPSEEVGDHKTKLADVIIKDNTFTIRQGDACLHATFAAPAPVKVQAGSRAMEITASAGHWAGQKSKISLDAVFAQGGDDFFVVATLQRGDPPPVKVEGRGLDAKVRVGNRSVRFDGQKVVLE